MFIGKTNGDVSRSDFGFKSKTSTPDGTQALADWESTSKDTYGIE